MVTSEASEITSRVACLPPVYAVICRSVSYRFSVFPTSCLLGIYLVPTSSHITCPSYALPVATYFPPPVLNLLRFASLPLSPRLKPRARQPPCLCRLSSVAPLARRPGRLRLLLVPALSPRSRWRGTGTPVARCVFRVSLSAACSGMVDAVRPPSGANVSSVWGEMKGCWG